MPKSPAADMSAITLTIAKDGGAVSNSKLLRQRARCCIKVAPWVSGISCIMVAVGLAVWYIYAGRALTDTQAIAGSLFGDAPIPLLQHLAHVQGWVRLLMVVVVSCLLGVTMTVSLFRSYQYTARLPTTRLGAPGKLSYGSYAGLIAVLNFAWWLLTIVVSLLLAGYLVWLAAAFMLQSALYMGVRDTPNAQLPSSVHYAAATKAVGGLSTYADKVAPALAPEVASLPEVEAFSDGVNKLIAHSAVPVNVCPATCFNLGSFQDVLRVPSSCACSNADTGVLRAQSTHLWQTLVHVLAALGLMGLGCLWQLMNMSANFAHARRDMQRLSGPQTLVVAGDAIAAIHTTPSSRKATPSKVLRSDQDATFAADTSSFRQPTPAAVDAMLDGGLSNCEGVPAPEPATYPSAYEAYDETPVPAASAGNTSATPQRRASSPSPRTTADATPTEASPGGSRGNTFNTTAQRYAAYRLRAAQAAAAKSSPANEGRKQWVR